MNTYNRGKRETFVYLDDTRAELHVNELVITDNRYFFLEDRMQDEFAVQVLVPRVIWVHSNRAIAEHGFDARSGYNKLVGCTYNWVRETVQNTKLYPATAFNTML